MSASENDAAKIFPDAMALTDPAERRALIARALGAGVDGSAGGDIKPYRDGN
jgi:hypothetical protein